MKKPSNRQQQTTECPLSPWAGRRFARPVERSSLCCQSETRLALSVSSTISTRAGSSQAQMLRADRSEIAESAMHKHNTEYRNRDNFAPVVLLAAKPQVYSPVTLSSWMSQSFRTSTGMSASHFKLRWRASKSLIAIWIGLQRSFSFVFCLFFSMFSLTS